VVYAMAYEKFVVMTGFSDGSLRDYTWEKVMEKTEV